MTTQTKSAAEIRQEVESVSRRLEQNQSALHALLMGTKTEDGKRAILPHQAEQIRHLESECRKGTEAKNSLKLEYLEAKTAEDLANGRGEPLESARLFSGEGGLEGSGAQKTVRLPETLGDAFINSKSYKAWQHGAMNQNAATEVPVWGAKEFALKATYTSADFTGYERPPGAVTLGQQQLTVADLFAQGQTSAPTIRYVKEDTFTNAATTVAEGAAKPEASWDLSEVDAAVRKIAVTTKVTDELFSDYPTIRSYINDRLPFMVRQREELQLLAGDGIAPNILGVLNVSGILTYALSGETNVDAIYKGITKVRTEGFFEPDAVVIDPTNWTPIRLLKTVAGEYIWGAPSLQGPETIFGKRVVVTVNMTDNTALVGAFRMGGTVYYRQGLRVEATNSNEDDFEKNLITMRAEQREALAVWRPKAFCTVTGLTTS